MTERPDYMGDESHDEIVAGEYVLGVLSIEDRRQVEARMAADPGFAMRVKRWQSNLESFDEDYGTERPPRELFDAIESRLFGDEARPESLWGRLWSSVAFWRAATLGSFIMALGFAAAAALLTMPATVATPLVAELAGEGATFKLLAAYDAATGRLKLTPAAGTKDEPKSLELWMIEGDGIPRSLGVLSDDGTGTLLVPAAMRRGISEGTTLAISLEPPGGSPTGKATGPVIAVGQITAP